MIEWRTRIALALLAVAFLATTVSRADDGGETDSENAGWSFRFSPGGDLYPRHVADPRLPTFSFVGQSYATSPNPAAGDNRYGVRMGGRYGLLRVHPENRPDRGFQLAIEAGFMAQFDADNSTDNQAWDGLYGFHVAWAPREDLAFRLAMLHDSSHVGDEYIERTGRQRINYTRQEYALGASWRPAERWRVYGEGGYAFDLRNEALMAPWRLQAGLEYHAPFRWWGGRTGWYAATDLSSFEEDDWSVNSTVQVGLRIAGDEGRRVYRVGIESYHGRSHYGEFFQDRERYIGFGLWFDL